MVEQRAESIRRVHEKIHRPRTQAEKERDFNLAKQRTIALGLPPREQETRIRLLESAHLGIPYIPVESAPSAVQTEIAPALPKRSRRTRP